MEGDDDIAGTTSLGHQSNAVGDRLSGHYISKVDAHRASQSRPFDRKGAVLEDTLHGIRQLDVERKLTTHLERPSGGNLNLRPFDAKVVLLGPRLMCLLDGRHGVHLHQTKINKLVSVVFGVDAYAQNFLC